MNQKTSGTSRVTNHCQRCGGDFTHWPSRHRRFCSKTCARRVPLSERFWKSVNRTAECWDWTGGFFPNGYGKTSLDGKSLLAHRVSYELAIGPIPDGLDVLHQCDRRSCVRPEHLFLGDQHANMVDMMEKGRENPRRGASCARAKLSERRVQSIRLRGKPADVTYKQLATEYGVSTVQVIRILCRTTWAWLADVAPHQSSTK